MPRVVIHQDPVASDCSVDSYEHTSRSSHPSYDTPATSDGSPLSRNNTQNSSQSPHPYYCDEDYHSASNDDDFGHLYEYASSTHSEEDTLEYAKPTEEDDYSYSDAIPATSSDFAELFPSSRTLSIQHDDSTLDGNMNLRVDTCAVAHDGQSSNITLYHLRMYDLKRRESSLRRYCRDSGREICQSKRKQQHKSPLMARPTLSRSFSNAFAALKPYKGAAPSSPHRVALERQDSGYDSDGVVSDDEDETSPQNAQTQVSTDSISLEFSNYAQVNLKRCGMKASKRYEFVYWGHTYAWRRVVRRSKGSEVVSFHLMRHRDNHAAAHIVPQSLDPRQAYEEQDKGGWIPPCSMWLADSTLINGHTDVADVVVATGLAALMDDSIRRRFQSKHAKQLIVPTPETSSGAPNVDYIGPKRLIDEAFGRASPTSPVR